ncbi:MAG: DUF1574 family protein [Chloroflexi bacterium]|nr:DUF1574 family protein [Chloroflexota bacterium]
MRFTVIFLGTLVLLLAAAATINYLVNPYAIYPTRSLAPVSSNDLERSLRELENPNHQPELVVFGSSRSSRLLPRDLECYSGLKSANQAYAGATPEGYFALASYMLENKPAPKMLLIGVDIEAFQIAAKFGDKVSAIPRLQRYLNGASQLQNWWLDATSLVSSAQLNDSARVMARLYGADLTQPTWLDRNWKEFVNTLAPRKQAATTTQAKTASATPAPTKTPRPPKGTINRAEITPANVIKHYRNRFRDYTALSTEQQDYFQALIQLAYAKNIPVKVFITTLHPQLIAELNKQGFYPKRYADVRAWLKKLSQAYAFDYYDFSTPDKFGGNNTDFFNLSHVDEVNSARLIGAMFTGTGYAAKCLPQP